MKQQNVKALKLASRFSLPPNALGYCGGEDAPSKLLECIKTEDCTDVEKELEGFIVLNPYLKTIAQVTNKGKFSYEVIEAYCIGNNLLKEFKNDDYDLLLENFLIQGVPDWFVEELREDRPKNFIPNHLFQVLHIGVGKVSGSVPYNNDTINNCMIKWGEVIKVGDNTVDIDLVVLPEDRKITSSVSNVPYSRDVTPKITVGNIVAVHWNQVIMVLSKDHLKKLSFWTKEILDKL